MTTIIIKEDIHQGIPYNQYQPENPKGLVFIQHGFESNKNRGADYLALNIARYGYLVVSIDAYMHGLRIKEPFISGSDADKFKSAFKIIDQTGNDILSLYKDLFEDEYSEFDLIGVSMGGMIAYNVATKTNRINKLIPVISTPLLYDFAKWVVDYEDKVEYYKVFEEIKEDLKRIDPVGKFTEKNYKSLHLINTTKDQTVPHNFSEIFYHKHQNTNMTLSLYNEEHRVNKDMQKEIIEHIVNEKVVI